MTYNPLSPSWILSTVSIQMWAFTPAVLSPLSTVFCEHKNQSKGKGLNFLGCHEMCNWQDFHLAMNKETGPEDMKHLQTQVIHHLQLEILTVSSPKISFTWQYEQKVLFRGDIEKNSASKAC